MIVEVNVSIPVRVLDVLKLVIVRPVKTDYPVSIPVRVLDVLNLHKIFHFLQAKIKCFNPCKGFRCFEA